jgi:hypothetical protein
MPSKSSEWASGLAGNVIKVHVSISTTFEKAQELETAMTTNAAFMSTMAIAVVQAGIVADTSALEVETRTIGLDATNAMPTFVPTAAPTFNGGTLVRASFELEIAGESVGSFDYHKQQEFIRGVLAPALGIDVCGHHQPEQPAAGGQTNYTDAGAHGSDYADAGAHGSDFADASKTVHGGVDGRGGRAV